MQPAKTGVEAPVETVGRLSTATWAELAGGDMTFLGNITP